MQSIEQRKPGLDCFLKDTAGETPIENAIVMLIVVVVSVLALMVVMAK
jgi:hypothetical protein